jgi:S1-C subfamily serine protease
MMFRKLHAETREHYRERFPVWELYPVRSEQRTDGERRDFAQKWIEGRATLSEWIKAGPGEVAAAEQKLSQDQEAIILKRRVQLYDWWLEYRVQEQLMRNLREVRRYAPHQVEAYAQFELEQLGRFLSGEMTDLELLKYRMERYLDRDMDYNKILSSMAEGYMRIYDIRDPAHFQYGEALLRFKEYLELIAREGLQEEPVVIDLDGLPYGLLWQDLMELTENLTVQYRSKQWGYKDESDIDYDITGVSGWRWPYDLRRRLLAVFEAGFEDLLLKLASLKQEEQQHYLEFLKDCVGGLLGAIGDATYVREEDEHGPKKEFQYRRFTVLKYQGDNDLHFVFNRRARKFMDFRLQDYVKEWEEGINIIVRKIEHALNNLNLIAAFSGNVIYDLSKILDNIFVLDSPVGASQGTAFYLQDVGIVTCDHCVRRDAQDAFYPDLVIYRGDKLKKQARVSVVKSHAHLDIAILELDPGEGDFLGEGLEKADSDVVRQLDQVLAVGFPNYNFGDSGAASIGHVIGMRTISGVQHFLLSNSLVEGNSGGPVLNREGKVIGIVVTGSDSFRTAPKTEKHGLVPINTLNILLG